MLYIKPNQLQCNEFDFLQSFLSSGFIDNINQNSNYQVSLIHEPYTGYGYADLVCVIWDKEMRSKWNEKRNNLDKIDIKILHHLYNCKKYKSILNIVEDLGFKEKVVFGSIEKLLSARVIKGNRKDQLKIKPINEIYYVKEIISIEAKLHDWKRALEQSINNTYFSSKSFTLLPHRVINKNLLEYFDSTDVGIISFEKNYEILIKPKRNNIPSTLFSWFFNEYLGRNIFNMA